MGHLITLCMSGLRRFAHENKAILSVLVLSVCLVVIVLAIYGIPDDNGSEGPGPLGALKGLNYILPLVVAVPMVVAAYFIYRYVSDRGRFEALMASKSQAIFKRNQIEIERLALRLTTKEEQRVVEMMKKYKIR